MKNYKKEIKDTINGICRIRFPDFEDDIGTARQKESAGLENKAE